MSKKDTQQHVPKHGPSGLFRGKTDRPLDQFDYDALAALPDEGAMINRYLADALSVLQLKKKMDATDIDSNFFSMRLRDLRDRGLVTSRPSEHGSGGTHKWQRTPEGRKVAMGHVPAASDNGKPEAAQA